MRLWHYKIIPYLPRQQLIGQHRECCALRGNSWGKKHSTVDYVFRYSPDKLFSYHKIVILEMMSRGYTVEDTWLYNRYRGKNCKHWEYVQIGIDSEPYPEHNYDYLLECLNNLESKGYLQKAGSRLRIRTGKSFRMVDI